MRHQWPFVKFTHFLSLRLENSVTGALQPYSLCQLLLGQWLERKYRCHLLEQVWIRQDQNRQSYTLNICFIGTDPLGCISFSSWYCLAVFLGFFVDSIFSMTPSIHPKNVCHNVTVLHYNLSESRTSEGRVKGPMISSAPRWRTSELCWIKCTALSCGTTSGHRRVIEYESCLWTWNCTGKIGRMGWA
jgi:hypothetical protein